jgi:hypothetical protein
MFGRQEYHVTGRNSQAFPFSIFHFRLVTCHRPQTRGASEMTNVKWKMENGYASKFFR